MQSLFDEIRNIKHESRVKYKKLKEARMDWKHQSEVIEMEFNKAVVTLANLLFRITLDDKDKHLLVKTLKKNGSFLDAAGLKKNQFDISILNAAIACLEYKYTTE